MGKRFEKEITKEDEIAFRIHLIEGLVRVLKVYTDTHSLYIKEVADIDFVVGKLCEEMNKLVTCL